MLTTGRRLVRALAATGGTALAACSEPVVCIAEYTPPISVVVTDSVSGAFLVSIARGVVVGRTAIDSLKRTQVGNTLFGGTGKGPFDVRISAVGYADWSVSGVVVQVVGGDCPYPVTRLLQARLLPAS